MRRTFLFGMIAGGSVFVLCGNRTFAADTDSILGDWHLSGAADDEVNVPQHRMDLRFRTVSGELKGAILSRNDRSEIPLASSAFDGSTLRFRMEAPNGKTPAEMPTMVMTWNGARFKGAWTNGSGQKTGPELKLVRCGKGVSSSTGA